MLTRAGAAQEALERLREQVLCETCFRIDYLDKGAVSIAALRAVDAFLRLSPEVRERIVKGD